MSSRYVLNFSNASFGELIAMSLGIDIWDDCYNYGSGSKANRLRGFWQLRTARPLVASSPHSLSTSTLRSALGIFLRATSSPKCSISARRSRLGSSDPLPQDRPIPRPMIPRSSKSS